jgi:transmembrane sensor
MQHQDEFFLSHNWTTIGDLIYKYKIGQISDREQLQIDEWIDADVKNRMLFEQLMNSEVLIEELKRYDDSVKRMAVLRDRVVPRSEEPSTNESGARIMKLKIIRWVAAASILLVVAAITYYILNTPKPAKTEVADVNGPIEAVGLPARQKATLTLSNGQVVLLDKSKTGVLARESGSEIVSKDGQLVYKNAPGSSGTTPLFNILTTGLGETFSTVLEDGTTIWLNAGSRVRYPLSFGDERSVELEYGEAYLEVVHNDKTFILEGGHGKIEVLGTKFNVRKYSDETAMTTSLLEGKVKVEHAGNESATLIPGQQSVFYMSNKQLRIVKGDVNGAASWVHGILHFDNSNLSDILRELSRWYDMEIEYRTTPTVIMRGDIERNIPLSELLDALSKMARVHFKVEGKKIIVMP